MIKKTLLAGLLLLVALSLGAQTVVKPSVKTKTSFAIVVDNASYEKVKDAIYAYRSVVEKDGLGTYIIADDWKSPEAIRTLLIKYHADKSSPLEGVVFIGDIPIPMIRDAHHLSSAFKMNPKINWHKSSIPSDRYYDDFGLTFDFIKQDTIQPLYHYYSLRNDSEQRVYSDIYSARIRPIVNFDIDKYTQLEKYLRKVVAERTSNPNNIIDNLTMARGHGYNSEAISSWAGEQQALREQFPEAFSIPGGWVRFMDFEDIHPAKPAYLNDVQRPELDVMLFHHHGSSDLQLLNGYRNGSDVNTSIENAKKYIRSKVLAAHESGKSKEEAIKGYMDYLNVPYAWCEEAFDPKKIEEDSLFNLAIDINLQDIYASTPNARFVMFDACFNGSFHRDEYIAGAYLFNDGKTIVTQGNTVNVIQDKWPDEFIGLLNAGVRVGQWGKQVHYLETHIIGDPTFRFANNSNVKFDINEALSVHGRDVGYWKKLLNHPNVDVQSMALRVLAYGNYNGISELLRKAYFESSSMIVRMEALELLAMIDDDNFVEVLRYSLADSYELIRRLSVNYVGANGSAKLAPAYAESIIVDRTSKRVRGRQSENIKLYDNLDKLAEELAKQANARQFYDRKYIDDMIGSIERQKVSRSKDLAMITSPSSPVKEVNFEVNALRNIPVPAAADILLAIVSDVSRDTDLRVLAAEVLGWYNLAYNKAEIVSKLQQFVAASKDEKVVYEAIKTINRLK